MQNPGSPVKAPRCGNDLSHSMICKVDQHVKLRWQHIEPVAMHLFDSYRKSTQAACADVPTQNELPQVQPEAGQSRKVVRLQPWLEAISSDLQAVSRFRSLDVVSVLQPALGSCVTQRCRQMVSAVALDRCDQLMAVVGVPSPVATRTQSAVPALHCSGTVPPANSHEP